MHKNYYLFSCLFLFSFSCAKDSPKAGSAQENPIEPIDHKATETILGSKGEKLDHFLQGMTGEGHFSGVVLVMQKEKVLLKKGYGKSTGNKDIDTKTVLHVASITKQFTAAAILQLVEKHKIALHDSINKYLPANYHSDKWNHVTVHHLLSHTSGIPDYSEHEPYYEVERGFCLGNTIDGMLRQATKRDLEFSPGSKCMYCNIGYTLLGIIIETQSGEPYEKYIKEKILDPLGMKDSGIHIEGHKPRENEAEGFYWDSKAHKFLIDREGLPVTPSDGGLYTTVDDFVKWVRVLQGRTSIISKKSLALMTHPVLDAGLGNIGYDGFYGYGLFIANGVYHHPGFIVGFRSHFLFDPKKDLLIVVFTNNTTNEPHKITAGLQMILENKDEL